MSVKSKYCLRNMRIRDNFSAKAGIDESSKLKNHRKPLEKKGKIDNISSESITIIPLKVIPEKNQEIKTQEKMLTCVPTAQLKAVTKSENELNGKKKAKQYQNEKVKKRQLSNLKSIKQCKTEMM